MSEGFVEVNKKIRFLYLAVIGLAMTIIIIVVGFIAFIGMKDAESATTPGTCLPTEKGGTGCFDTAFLNKLYPIGAIYTSTSNTNPGTFLGGTWESFGNGRTLMGVGSNGTTNYTAAEQTGGADSVTLTLSQVPAHSHTARWYGTSYTGYPGDTFGGFNAQGYGVWQDYSYIQTDSKGGGGSHENRTSYITVYFWKRTS